MPKAGARAVLLVVLVSGVFAAVGPTPASAFESYYNCLSKPASQWCDGRANGTFDGLHSWDWTESWHGGTWNGTVVICDHIRNPSTGYVPAGNGCDTDYTVTYYGNVTCACYEAELMHTSSGTNRNLYGYADATF